ncbi:hypothetical protein B0G76_8635 [Paraburkholderia sp. BL23I1N1]|uniref:hypothetical protein n=1 Tax=Paraburkholderia sp. BL23I1N1 TaxID=1938802 RepID=UPI000E72E7DB|nr:hypothetical protein [Paraburkholderia sp. BL23I1N1]RKE23935.1 hypothetical protein B0G76_8635 [Paraburkholderia sp. BL23I1N1]
MSDRNTHLALRVIEALSMIGQAATIYLHETRSEAHTQDQYGIPIICAYRTERAARNLLRGSGLLLACLRDDVWFMRDLGPTNYGREWLPRADVRAELGRDIESAMTSDDGGPVYPAAIGTTAI